ncbi:MAG: MarR family transcriptional regulator [Pseudobdellovibrio sp.]
MEKNKLIAMHFIRIAPSMIRAVKAEIQIAADGQITHPQYRILASIDRGNFTVSQIAIDHGVSQPAMSKMVDLLVKKGLIKRSYVSKDRRQIDLKLSAKGLVLFKELKNKAAKNLAKKIKVISKKEQNSLNKSLDQLETFLMKIKKDN